jgi:hypothetical protein
MTGPPIREPPVEVDGDMQPADIVSELQRLKFNGPDELRPIKVDQHVRDYLVASLSARHAARRP